MTKEKETTGGVRRRSNQKRHDKLLSVLNKLPLGKCNTINIKDICDKGAKRETTKIHISRVMNNYKRFKKLSKGNYLKKKK